MPCLSCSGRVAMTASLGVLPACNTEACGLADGSRCGVWVKMPPLPCLLSMKGGGRSQISDAPPSPQSSNLRVGSQLPFHIVTAGPEDDASGAAGLELSETLAQ